MKAIERSSPFELKLEAGGLRLKALRLSTVLRIVIGPTFCASGVLKLVNHEKFEEAVSGYGFLPEPAIELVPLLLPQVEVCLGILLVFGVKTRAVSAAIAAMLAAFTSIGAASWALGEEVDCGCFPVDGRTDPIGTLFFVRNGLLILACLRIALGGSAIRGFRDKFFTLMGRNLRKGQSGSQRETEARGCPKIQ